MIAARNNDAFKSVLDQAEAELKAGRTAEAGTLLLQAGRQTDDQTASDLRERYGHLDKDQRTVRELNEIFEERWMISRSDIRLDNARAKRRYPDLFQRYDISVGHEPAALSVERIRRSLIAETLSNAMAEWFFVDPKSPGLLAVVDLLDPEPNRATLRAAIANGDNDRVNEIGKTIDAARLAPAYAIGLGEYCSDGVRILKSAWKTHPDSFPLALTISIRSPKYDKDTSTEAVGWARIAIALRPDNALSHYYLALALNDNGFANNGQIAEELRRAIQLAPRFAKAYGQLAKILREDRNPEAVDIARKAIELDHNNVFGHVVILMEFLAKKEYTEAAKVYRQLMSIKLDYNGDEHFEAGYTMGVLSVAIDVIHDGLIRVGRPFEAYSLFLEGASGGSVSTNGHPDDDSSYKPARAAALAGTGQGLDAPSPAERPAIRKHALEWLTSRLDIWKKHATAVPVGATSIVGLLNSPFGDGPFLVASAFLAREIDLSAERARNCEVVHKRMKEWLSDPDLVRLRDDQWLAKLPADEREQWRKFWAGVRYLRDRTASAEATLPNQGK